MILGISLPWQELPASLPILPWQWQRLMRFRARGLPLACCRLLLLIMPVVSGLESDCTLQGLEYFAGIGMVCSAMRALGYDALAYEYRQHKVLENFLGR